MTLSSAIKSRTTDALERIYSDCWVIIEDRVYDVTEFLPVRGCPFSDCPQEVANWCLVVSSRRQADYFEVRWEGCYRSLQAYPSRGRP